MTASVEIITTRKADVLSVPLAAVTTRDEEEAKPQDDGNRRQPQVVNEKDKKAAKKEPKTVVFVNNGGVAKMVEVKTGISDYENIEILSGVTDSVEVVTGPFLVVSKRLKEGDKIRKAEKKENKEEEKK